ncbi:MAG: 2-C-methyl-D-erythritol 2,4-cyclodiphosphate synthase [Nitrospirales bacterium]|nr:2-C-methyl-D-erythritol 2,4-cyclodiphosphate synthase [Nitrospirales bacterium]
MRVGFGYDVHALCAGRALILGGITIPHSQGLHGHSDADVLTHAVCDALLGAMGEGDLGTYFPSSDPQFKNIDSLQMLQAVHQKLTQRGYGLINLDTVIMAEAPRLGPYLADMQKQLASVLCVSPDLVNVKVKSGDKLGIIGRQEGMAAQAVCLIHTEQHEMGPHS